MANKLYYGWGYVIVSGGGTGFIGTQIINSLSHKGASYTCISRMPGPNRISWVRKIESL